MVWKAQRPELTVTHLLAGRPDVVLYRIVRHRSPDEADFASAFVLGHPPPRRLQKQSAPVWMATSMLSGLDAARSRARLFPVLGRHVARVELTAGNGFAIAFAERPRIPAWQHPRQHPDPPLRPFRPDSRTFWTRWTHRTDLTPGFPG